jgi:hypothetical protein
MRLTSEIIRGRAVRDFTQIAASRYSVDLYFDGLSVGKEIAQRELDRRELCRRKRSWLLMMNR